MSYDAYCSRTRDEMRRFQKAEFSPVVTCQAGSDIICVVNYIFLLDALFYNDLPKLSDYSDATTITALQDNSQLPLHHRCTYYSCACDKCRWIFTDEKYAAAQPHTVLLKQKERRLLFRKQSQNADQISITFRGAQVKPHASALRLLNYELTEQNETV